MSSFNLKNYFNTNRKLKNYLLFTEQIIQHCLKVQKQTVFFYITITCISLSALKVWNSLRFHIQNVIKSSETTFFSYN